jgi:DNA polymerase/3'-5' exonuclease PolX
MKKIVRDIDKTIKESDQERDNLDTPTEFEHPLQMLALGSTRETMKELNDHPNAKNPN